MTAPALRAADPVRRLLRTVTALLLALTTVAVLPPAPSNAEEGGTGGTADHERDLLLPDDGAWFGTFLRDGDLDTGGTYRSDIERIYRQREQMLGRAYDIAHHYYFFDEAWPTWREPYFGASDTASMVSWAPVPSREVTSGQWDQVIADRADAVVAYGDPLFVRYFWEMDGQHHGDKAGTPEEFVAAWRRIVDTFRARGADNAIWVWCPTTWGFEVDRVDQWYPGDDYVDWLCADGYNFFGIQETARYREAVDIFGDFHDWGMARGKPMMAGEYGVIEYDDMPGAKADWYDQLRLQADQLPGIKAWVYFDTVEDRFNGDNDWRPTTSWSARNAYVELANSDWFSHDERPLTHVHGSTAGWPTGEDQTPEPAAFPATCPTAHYVTKVAGGDGTANGASATPALDADGSHVVFSSYARDLHPDDRNGKADVFVVADGERNLVSWDVDGGPSNEASFNPTISDDGRYVAFESRASDLVVGDNNGLRDVFVRDLQTGMTRRVSVRDGGGEGVGGAARNAMISGDGRYVVFESSAHNLVAQPTPAPWNVYRHDLVSGDTELVSVAADGTRGADAASSRPTISDDGRLVAFASTAADLVADDANGAVEDVFVRDMTDGTTALLSSTPAGGGSDGASDTPVVSGSGSHVAYRSLASNLVAGDTNGRGDVMVVDLATRVTTRASVKPNGRQVWATSHSPAISDDGRVVAFHTTADIAPGGSGRKDQVHLRADGTTTALRTASGDPLAARSQQAALDDTGARVAFRTDARNLCSATTDANNRPDIGLVSVAG